MKKNELRRLLKPLVKQCIKEVLFEEGVLSNIVSEVVVGLSSNLVLENKTKNVQHSEPPVREQLHEQLEDHREQEVQDMRRQMLEALGQDSYNGVDLFENTQPLAKGGEVSSTGPSSAPLSGVDPSDPGVDISGLVNKTGVWKSLVGNNK